MTTAVINSDSRSNITLLIELADKIGIRSKILSHEEVEDIGMIKAIKEGQTGVYIDTEKYLKKLRNK